MAVRARANSTAIPAINPASSSIVTTEHTITAIIARLSVGSPMFFICSVVSSGFAPTPARW